MLDRTRGQHNTPNTEAIHAQTPPTRRQTPPRDIDGMAVPQTEAWELFGQALYDSLVNGLLKGRGSSEPRCDSVKYLVSDSNVTHRLEFTDAGRAGDIEFGHEVTDDIDSYE